MKTIMNRSLCVLLAMLLVLGSMTALADEKREIVYVIADAAGQPQRVIVNAQTADEVAAKADDSIGTDRQMPVSVSFLYELNGETIDPANLAGKSGHLTIRIDYTSNLSGTAEIKGESVELPVPFIAATVLPLDKKVFSNIEVTNGRVIDVGRGSAVVCYGLPGLGEALNLGGFSDVDPDISIPTGAVISADVTDYSSDASYTIVAGIPKTAADHELSIGIDIEGVSDELRDAMKQLTDGAAALADGTGALQAGAEELAAGTGELLAGAGKLSEGAAALSNGLAELNGNSAALSEGADAVIAAILETVNEKLQESVQALAAVGIELNTLTIDNYAAEIDRIEAALLEVVEARVYEQANTTLTEKVTAAVREQVEEKVTEAVRAQVTDQVTAAAREQVATKVEEALPDAVRTQVTESVRMQVADQAAVAVREQIEAQVRKTGVADEDVEAGVSEQFATAEVQAMLDQQVAGKMDTEEVKTMIDALVEAQLASDDVRAKADAAIEEQMASDAIRSLVAQNIETAMQGDEAQAAIAGNVETQMASVEVMAVIEENVEAQKESDEYLSGVQQAILENGIQGATYQALEELRCNLDGIKAFRDGLTAYTAGVGQAADGAIVLAGGASELHDGVNALNDGASELAGGAKTLNDGAVQLKDGLVKFDTDAVQKLTGYLDGDIREILDRVKAVVDMHYAGYQDETTDLTLFIIRAEGI